MGDRDWRPFIYGGLASIIAEFGTFPIDTTKTRLQIQGQRIDPRHVELRYTGMVDCFVKTSKQEGIKALYCGSVVLCNSNMPNLNCLADLIEDISNKKGNLLESFMENELMSRANLCFPPINATYGTIKFGTYYSLKKALAAKRPDGGSKEHLPTNTFCAAFAGGLSSAIANPTDVLKVRMQVGDEKRNLVRCFVDIYQLEGARGLWRGVGPTSQRAALIAAVELPVYDACKRRLALPLGDAPLNHFLSSLVASLGSAVASTPLDVVRTRLMNQRKVKEHAAAADERIYKGTVDCFVRTVRNEGFLALYKGFVPTWLRMGPWNIIFFITYEQLKRFY